MLLHFGLGIKKGGMKGMLSHCFSAASTYFNGYVRFILQLLLLLLLSVQFRPSSIP
jgi:hypothetical protein